MAYFRVKWRVLAKAYRLFLEQCLLPGAPIILVRDASTWPVTRYGDRHLFQVGARGGMTAQEYLTRPDVPIPDDVAPEAEWGFAEPLAEAVEAWGAAAGHPVVEIGYDHPQHPSSAVATTTRSWLRDRGEPAERLLVSSFIVHDPWRTITSGSVPFWTAPRPRTWPLIWTPRRTTTSTSCCSATESTPGGWPMPARGSSSPTVPAARADYWAPTLPPSPPTSPCSRVTPEPYGPCPMQSRHGDPCRWQMPSPA
jgi:hypothetical protein